MQQEITSVVGVLPSDFTDESKDVARSAAHEVRHEWPYTMDRGALSIEAYGLPTVYCRGKSGYVAVFDIDGSDLLTTLFEVDGGLAEVLGFHRTLLNLPPVEEHKRHWISAAMSTLHSLLRLELLCTSQVRDIIAIGDGDRGLVVDLNMAIHKMAPFATAHTSWSPLEAPIAGTIQAQLRRLNPTVSPAKDVILCFVQSLLTLGVEVMGGIVVPLIDHSCFLPTYALLEMKIFQASPQRGGESMTLRFYEGNRALARDNTLLAEIQLPELKMGWSIVSTRVDKDTGFIIWIEVTTETSAGVL